MTYYNHQETDTMLLSPEILPAKQPILVNEKTQVGGVDTKKYIEKMPKYDEIFEASYVDTAGDEDFLGFHNRVFDFCVNTAVERPWSLGSFQFYEMDEDKHQYKIMSYVNTTSTFSTGVYPQFILESVMKTAFNDDDFEFKVRTTPLPTPKETLDKGTYLTLEDQLEVSTLLTMSDVVGKTSKLSWRFLGCIVFAWFMVNSYVLIQVIRERKSFRKHQHESLG